jgi:hypothetical protein
MHLNAFRLVSRRCHALFLLLGLPVLTVAHAAGTGAGTAVDSSDRALSGATVTLLDPRAADASASCALQPGTYPVSIELPGFHSGDRHGFKGS